MLAENLQTAGNEIDNMEGLSHKRVLVVGLGKTGFSCARYLNEHGDRKSTRLNSSHVSESRMPSSA